jgi:hypothetical protein
MPGISNKGRSHYTEDRSLLQDVSKAQPTLHAIKFYEHMNQIRESRYLYLVLDISHAFVREEISSRTPSSPISPKSKHGELSFHDLKGSGKPLHLNEISIHQPKDQLRPTQPINLTIDQC